ncbi:hypothetical protein [Sclerotinia sclerotiorum umbra-like virus 3]|nr:hypothetical protein [Sclerotinia sclerotiorum umbra-like virus 3]
MIDRLRVPLQTSPFHRRPSPGSRPVHSPRGNAQAVVARGIQDTRRMIQLASGANRPRFMPRPLGDDHGSILGTTRGLTWNW